MKKFITLASLCFFLTFAACKQIDGKVEEITTTKKNMSMDSVLRHVVLFKFKESTSTKQLKKMEDAFGDLPNKIEEIKSYEWGINTSPEGLNKGLTHCFVVTFHSERDRDSYLPHPAHQAFVALATPFIEDVTVVDFWTR